MAINDEQVEAAARALWDIAELDEDREEGPYSWDYLSEHARLWPDSYGPIRGTYLAQARAALVASAQVRPDDWDGVPGSEEDLIRQADVDEWEVLTSVVVDAMHAVAHSGAASNLEWARFIAGKALAAGFHR